MEDTWSYEALSAGDELGGEVRLPEDQPRADALGTVTEGRHTCGGSVVGVLASNG